MKKTVLSIAAAALVSSALFTGCGSDDATPVAVVTTATIGTGPALSIGQTIGQSAKGYQTVSGGLLDLDGDVTTTNDLFVFGNLVMQAPANYSVVTPITDLVVAQIEAGLTQANAEAAVATALGLKTTDLMYTSETAKAAGLDATTQAKLLATNATLLASFANTTTRSVRAESIPNPFATTTTSSSSSVASSTSSVASSSAESIPNPFATSSTASSTSSVASSTSSVASSTSSVASSTSSVASSSSSAAFDANAVAATILANLSATFTATVAATQASIATSLAAGKSLQAIAIEQVTSIFAAVVKSSTDLTGAAATAYAAAIAGHSSSTATSSSSTATSSSSTATSSSSTATSSSSTATSSSSSETIPNPFATSSTSSTSSVASSTSSVASSSAESIPNPFG